MTTGVIIDIKRAKTLVPEWMGKLLAHGDVLNRIGVFLMNADRVKETFDTEGEVEFICWKGSSEAFVKTLERPSSMPCDNHGVPGCQQRGCEIWLRQS